MNIVTWKNGVKIIREALAGELPELDVNRSSMKCTVRQARIVLGEDVCATLDAMADDANYPWALRQTLKYATVWERTLPEIDEIGWALGYTPEEIDELFRKAMAV